MPMIPATLQANLWSALQDAEIFSGPNKISITVGDDTFTETDAAQAARVDKETAFCESLATKITDHVKTASVSSTVTVTSVSGVMTGAGISGPGTGTAVSSVVS